METYTTTAAGRTVELEIVQNAPRGYAVNFHQIAECVGLINFHAEGFEAETSYTESGQWIALGVFAGKFEALAAIVEHLSQRLERLEDVEELPATQDPADAEALVMDALDPEVYGDHYGPAAIRDICRRAAYDLGIVDRRATPAQLPLIAARAVTMIRNEMAPTLLEMVRQDLADNLAALGWSATDRAATAFRHSNGRGYVALNFSADTITAYLPNDERFTVRTVDTSGSRLARIIAAYTE